FQVGVLDNDDVPRGLLDAAPDGRPLAAVAVLEDEPVDPPLRLQSLEDVAATVGRGIIDAHDLDVQVHGAHALDQRANGARFIVDRNDDTQSQRPRVRRRTAARRIPGTAVHHPSVIPYRLSFRYSVDGSIPSTSAARALLPPSACSTHRM